MEGARRCTQLDAKRRSSNGGDTTRRDTGGGQNPRFTAAPFQIASPRMRAQPIAKQARNTAVSHVRL
eukprot:3955207-Alexandrium_andersonii.AAC.1